MDRVAVRELDRYNTRIRELENEQIFLRKQYGEVLDQLAEAGMEIKRLQESVREARRDVFARMREKGYVVVPRPILGSTGFATLVIVMPGPDQDAIEREVME